LDFLFRDSCFLILIIFLKELAQAVAETSGKSAYIIEMSEQTRSIAVIEDEFTLKTGLKKMLEQEGFKAESLKPSSDILSKLVSLNPSIIITDLDQKNPADPFKTVSAIKSTEKLNESELFVYTGSIDVKIEVGLRKLKIVSYFTKSTNPEHLVTGIKNHFSWEEMSSEYDPFKEMEEEEGASQNLEDVVPLEEGRTQPEIPEAPRRVEDVAPLEEDQIQPEIPEAPQHDNSDNNNEFLDMLSEVHNVIEKKLDGIDENPEACYNMGVSYFEKGLMDQALAQLEKSSESPDWKLSSLSVIGAIHRNQGEFDKAIVIFSRCYKCTADSFARLGFRYEIADTQDIQGKLAEAYKMFATVYKADKGFRDTRERLLKIKAALKSKNNP